MNNNTAINKGATSKVIIDLGFSSNPRALSVGHFLHVNQYALLFKLMGETLSKIASFKKDLKESKNTVGYTRVHDVITIHGKRGSGKTTFLLSALSLLKNEKKLKDFTIKYKIQGLNSDRICVLDVMDPTLFACREHLLHAILCKISERVHEASFKQQAMNCYGDGADCMIEQWEKHISKLAKGLSSLGEVREGNEKNVIASARWEEASFTMQAEMESIQSSMDLEKCFYKVVAEALEILGKDAFVLALDDIDTRPSIGWHVLEVIRRYLTTPQILVVMSGDLDLLTSIIRREHAQGLGIDIMSEQATKSPYKERLDGLTEQYLLKILRSNARINLGNFISALYPMNVLKKTDASQINIRKTSVSEKGDSLECLLDHFFKFIHCYSEKECSFFRHTLMNTSCRTEIQLLDALLDFKLGDLSGEELAFRLCEIYFVQLTNFGIAPLEIQELLQVPQGVTRIINILFECGYGGDGLALLPDNLNIYKNEAVLALYVNMACAIKRDRYIAFVYLFKGCWLREVLSYMELTDRSTYRQIISYLGYNLNLPISYTAKHIATLLWPNNLATFKRLMSCGTLRIYAKSTQINDKSVVKSMYGVEIEHDNLNIPKKLQPFYNALTKQKKSLTSGYVNTPQSLQKNISSWHKDFITLGMLSLRRNNATYPLFSIVAMLSILGDIFALGEKVTVEDFEDIFRKYCLIDDFSIFLSNQSGQNAQASEGDNEIFIEIEEKSIDNETTAKGQLKFLHAMKGWYVNINTEKMVATTVLLARIMERYCKGLKRIDNSSYTEIFLGSYIHRCLVLFFNSILVEELLLNTAPLVAIKKNIFLDNPTGSDDIFVRNFGMINTVMQSNYTKDGMWLIENTETARPENTWKGNCPFFEAVFSCPLWGLYLDQDSDVWRHYKTFLQNNIIEEGVFCVGYKGIEEDFDNLYPLLNSVAIPKKMDAPKVEEKRAPKRRGKPQTKKHDDMRTQKGIDVGVPDRQFGPTSDKKVANMLLYYGDRINPAWKTSSKDNIPPDFEEFFMDMVAECYTHFDNKERQMKIVWALVCKA